MIEMLVYLTGMAFATALLFLIPLREVTQPPARWYWIVEVLFPGTSPSWSIFGGLTLVAWTCWLIYLLGYTKTFGNAAVITDIAIPNLFSAYGIPVVDPLAIWALFRPNWILVYVVPPVLFVVNLALVWRSRRRAA